MGNIEPLLAITKPAGGLNKPCQGNVNGRKSFAAERFNVKIPFISQTYTKAVAIFFRQSYTRTRNLVKYYRRVVFTESFHVMVRTDEERCSSCEREFDRHCKVQEKRHRDREPSRLPIKKIKSSIFTESFHVMVSTDEERCSSCEREFDRHCKAQEKRHRDREPSRLPIKKIKSSMKNRKAKRKLKRIFRKSTLKSSSLYKLATDYKLWYVTYVHRCDCFFLPALQILKDGQQTSYYKIVNKQVYIV